MLELGDIHLKKLWTTNRTPEREDTIIMIIWELKQMETSNKALIHYEYSLKMFPLFDDKS